MFSGRMMAGFFDLDEFGIRYFQVVGAMALITGAVELAFGIIGVRLCGRFDKAGFLLVIGIIQILVTAFSALYNKMMEQAGMRVVEQILEATAQNYGASVSMDPSAYAGLMGNPGLAAANFILPALFIVGALLNRMRPGAPAAPAQGQEGF